MVVDFTPQAGDQVEVFGHSGEFEILAISVLEGHYRYKLARLADGAELDGITYPMLTYSDAEKVRKALPQILPECRPWPDDFQNGEGACLPNYDIRSNEMYDGTPRVLVSFFLKPDAIHTPERARVRNEFFGKLHEQFQFIDIRAWLQFTAKEQRSVLSAAS